MTLTKIGASLGGAADTLLITQAGHGFVDYDRGKAVKLASTGLYELATAGSTTTADAVGIILQRIDANTLLLALSGRVTVDACVPTGTPGTVLFLPITSTKNVQNTGLLLATEPSTAGQVSKPMAVITISGSEMILFQMRGEVITTGVISIADDSVTSAKIVDGAILNADINASADIAFTKLADLTDGNILVGNGSNVPTSVNPSGDIDISNAGVFELNATAISGFSAKTTVVDADTVLLGDSAASGALKKMTRANFVAGVGAAFAGCRAKNNTDVIIAHNSATSVDFQDEDFDTDDFHSTSSGTEQFVIPSGKAGYYWLNFWGSMGGATDYIIVQGRIVLTPSGGSAGIIASNNAGGQTTSATNDPGFHVSCIYNLGVGDAIVFQVYFYSSGSNNRSLRSSTGHSAYAELYKIG